MDASSILEVNGLLRCCWRNLNITCSMSSSNKSSVLNLKVYVLVILLGQPVLSSIAIDVHQSHFCLSKASLWCMWCWLLGGSLSLNLQRWMIIVQILFRQDSLPLVMAIWRSYFHGLATIHLALALLYWVLGWSVLTQYAKVFINSSHHIIYGGP